MISNPVEDKINKGRKRLESIESELVRLNAAKQAEWNVIKDFTVSSERASAGYDRMKNITKEINDLSKEKRLIESFVAKWNP